jgi:hypothetical protein
MVGTLGLIAAVPITTALAAAVTVRSRRAGEPRPATTLVRQTPSDWDPAASADQPVTVMPPKTWTVFD